MTGPSVEFFIMLSGIIGIYIGLLFGLCVPILDNKKIDRKMRGHYRDLNQSDKVKVITTFHNIAEQYRDLSIFLPVRHLKRARNQISKLIYMLNKLYTE